jgi:glutamyl-tRNA reductase
MRLKYNPGETLESWAERVEAHEMAWARQEIARGADTAATLERVADRIVKKMLHPLIKERASQMPDYDTEASRERYRAAFADRTELPPDHVSDDQ